MKDPKNLLKKFLSICSNQELEHTPANHFVPTLSTILEAKSKLKNFVICILDKNSKQLVASCPRHLYFKTLKEVINNSAVFRKISFDEKQFISSTKFFSKLLKLHHIAPLKSKCKLSNLYGINKHKDLDRYRFICSQYNSPLRNILRLASRALQFLIKLVSRSAANHFILYQTSDLKKLLDQAFRMFRSTNKKHPEFSSVEAHQFDVKEMFTYLDRNAILDSVDWLFKETEKLNNNSAQTYHRLLRSSRTKIRVSKTKNENGKHSTGWYRPGDLDEDFAIFHFDLLKKLILLDFDHSHFRAGNIVLTQKNGVPIGGYLSAQLAILFCAYRESLFMNSLNPLQRSCLFGIRATDDLLLLRLHPNSTHNNNWFKTSVTDKLLPEPTHTPKIYGSGLTLERQPCNKTADFSSLKFVGSNVTIPTNLSTNPTISLIFKNEASLAETGFPDFPRFPYFYSSIPARIKKNTVLNMLHLIGSQCSDIDSITKSVKSLSAEISSPTVAYPNSFISHALRNKKLLKTYPKLGEALKTS